MPEMTDREESGGHTYKSFIPVSRERLVESMLAEGRLVGDSAQAFRHFSEILSAFLHFRFHGDLGRVKSAFAKFDPDDETLREAGETTREEEAEALFAVAGSILERANYELASRGDVEAALERSGVIPLRTEVDFNDFEQFSCYYRNRTLEPMTLRKFGLFKKVVEVETFGRVAVIMRTKGRPYFLEKFGGDEKKVRALNFEPGKAYTYLYKNIPTYDLELLFPNVKVGMRMVDRLMFGIPALGGGIAVLIKVIPHLILIAGAIIFFTLGKERAKSMLSFTEDQAKNLWPVITAALALSVALGGLAIKQYLNFLNRKTKFQKLISETLFFRSLATNRSVFSSVVDEAEEEEAKEMLLVVYHLTTMENRNPTVAELDAFIERWIAMNFEVSVDFDIHGPVGNLCGIEGLPGSGKIAGVPLMRLDDQGRCHLAPLAEANEILDCIWDGAFRHFS